MSNHSDIAASLPDITQAEVDAVSAALRSHEPGSLVVRFEQRLADCVGRRHAVAVSNGTAGLHLSLIVAGVGEGDLVLTSAFSDIAVANAILYQRAIPVFVDVDAASGNVSTELMMDAVKALSDGGTEGQAWLPPAFRDGPSQQRKLKAVLPVHMLGQPLDLRPIVETANRHGIDVIEDACQAIGSEHSGVKAGTYGDAAVFSFGQEAQITTGEGGAITTDSDEWASQLRQLRSHERGEDEPAAPRHQLTYAYGMRDINAALGIVQLERMGELLAQGDRVAQWYNDRLQDLDAIELPRRQYEATRLSWYAYVVRVRPPADRDALLSGLQQAGICARPYPIAVHLQPFLRDRFGYAPGDYPVAEELARTSLTLPFSGGMTESQVDLVCDAMRKVTDTSCRGA